MSLWLHMHSSVIISWINLTILSTLYTIQFDHPTYSLKDIIFLIIPLHSISKFFPFCFTFCQVNRCHRVFFASVYFSLLVILCFHPLPWLFFSPTQFLTLPCSFSICLTRSFVRPGYKLSCDIFYCITKSHTNGLCWVFHS